MVDPAVRLFIGIPLEGPANDVLAALADGYAHTGWRTVPRGTLHVTLRFLGDTPAALVPALGEAVTRVAASAPGPFRVDLGTLTGLPRPSAARVLAARADADGAALAALGRALDAALGPFAIAPERRPYFAHVTLARSGPVPRPVTERPIAATFTAARVVLWQSRLERSGARYVERASARLGETPS